MIRWCRTLQGNEDITFDRLQTLYAASEATGQDISELLAEGGIEGLDDDLVAELEQVTSETGIDFDNLVAVNTVLETLPDGQVKQLMNDLGVMIEEGFADEINEKLTALSKIEGDLENSLNFGSYNDCMSGGGSNCAKTAAALGEGPLAE